MSPLERQHKEIKRRTNVVEIIPSRASLVGWWRRFVKSKTTSGRPTRY